MKYLLSILSALCITTACLAQKTNKPKAKPVAKAVKKPVAEQGAVTKYYPNDITMKIKGFKISEAGLYFEDGTTVPIGNTVDLNQKVVLYVVIDSGYNVIDGKVFPGSSERISLSNGDQVLKNDDLFAEYTDDGVSAEDGKHIAIKAVITQLDNKDQWIIVSFTIWDKKGTSKITGSYKLRIK
jgi:hypothetical protein